MTRTIGWILVGFFVVQGAATARMAGKEYEDVPLERLLANCADWAAKNPGDAHAQYVLARLHTMAFVIGADKHVNVEKEGRPGVDVPDPGDAPIRDLDADEVEKLEKDRRDHFNAAIEAYRKSAELDPKAATTWLGLAWTLEEGSRFAGAFEQRPETWQEEALGAYRRAFELTIEAERGLEKIGPFQRTLSVEAGEGVARLLKALRGDGLTDADRKEIAEVEKAIAEIEAKPHWITPVVFAMDDGVETLRELLSDRVARFDLDGLGDPSPWPWVGPDAGILVWDPRGKGDITSGRQLFGSVTWWLFWRDGYEPLMLLDDDHDGWLAGGELTGISVWHDADADGVSDLGEVVTAVQSGIDRIAAHATGLCDGVPSNGSGVRLLDGRERPTWDWAPISEPSE